MNIKPMNHASLVQRLLEKRGYKTPEAQKRFLNPDYDKHVADPFLLNDMAEAVDRLRLAKQNKELVIIYGDYDIDGLSATALLLDAFSSFGINAEAYIPDRFEEGYGLNLEALKKIDDMGADLVVTVDCGSVSVDVITEANSQTNLDIIVTDHHTVGDTLPECVAVINPKRQDNTYPFTDFAGVGVAFKLVQAMQQKLEGLDDGHEKWLLDLVALGTVCDVVSLVDENRVFVKWGLEVWRQTRRPGLKALLAVSGVDDIQDIDTSTMGFRIGPRLNASGRMEHARASLDTITSVNQKEAREFAERLNELNTLRRAEQDRIFQEARAMAEQDSNPVLVLANQNWSHGIVGIVAAKLLEEFKKPVFVLEILPKQNIAKGSARSFGDFKAVDAVRAFKSRISGGGHSAAAGITIKTSDINKFRETVNSFYESLNLQNQAKHLQAESDLDLTDLEHITNELVESLEVLAPFGRSNEEPIIKLSNVSLLSQRLVGAQKNHLQMSVSDKAGNIVRGIAFNTDEVHHESVDLMVKVKKSTFRPGTVEFIAESVTPALAS